MTSVVIVGGGPGGYEAALVARQLGADVTLVDRDGPGGSAVLTDCVPSKTLIATANVITAAASSASLGVLIDGRSPEPSLHRRRPQGRQRADQGAGRAPRATTSGHVSLREGITLMPGVGRLDAEANVVVARRDGKEETLLADAVLLATGARPRVLPEALPDGERILTWEQVYDLDEVPERLIVVGLRRHRGRVRRRLPRPRQPRRAHLLPRPRPAGRGSRRRAGARGGLRAPGHRGARLVAGDRRPPHRRRRRGHARRRRRRSRVARADGGRVGAEHRRPRPRAGGGRDRRRRVHPRRPGRRTTRARRLRRRRLHGRAHAGLRRRHAGPHRHVARARRRGHAPRADDGVQHGLHRPRDRHRGPDPARPRRRDASAATS